MGDIIYKGLEIKSDSCRYFNVKEGEFSGLVEDKTTSTLTITYTKGDTNRSLSKSLGLRSIGKEIEMEPTYKPRKFEKTVITLNGLELEKQTSDIHIIQIIIVSDSESRVIQDYDKTFIVVSSEDYCNQDFIKFLFFSDKLVYLKPIGKRPDCYKLRNFPKITISNKSININSESETIYSLRRRYDDYVIRAIDYQDQFILEIRKILEEYGIELVRQNREATLTKTSHISYQFSQTPIRYNHAWYSGDNENVLPHRLPVDFIFRCTDTVMFFDFKNKYNNVNLLTNFTEFKTTDKYGQRWSASIKWGAITEEFNHLYQSDDNSNFSNQCSFRCELSFYEVMDDRYQFINEIITSLEEDDNI